MFVYLVFFFSAAIAGIALTYHVAKKSSWGGIGVAALLVVLYVALINPWFFYVLVAGTILIATVAVAEVYGRD